MTFIIIAKSEETNVVFAVRVDSKNEKEARRDFFEIYRHRTYHILSCTLIPDDSSIRRTID